MRHEFSRQTKREALRRAGAGEVGNALCEAVGARYGLDPGQRCNAPLNHGVEFDHYPVPAGEKDSDVLDNCVACCKTCHKHKTRTYDIPMQAKDKRIRDRHQGIRQRSSAPMPGSKASGLRKRMNGAVERR
jgi:5-methylcytosine-specific restriction protein A